MKKYTVFCSVTAAPAAAKLNVTKSGSVLELGLDIHRDKFVVVAQYDHATPRPPQGFAPVEFVPWVEGRLREGFEVHVVYETCGLATGSTARCSRLERTVTSSLLSSSTNATPE